MCALLAQEVSYSITQTLQSLNPTNNFYYIGDVEQLLARLRHPLPQPGLLDDLKLRLRRLELKGELSKLKIECELHDLKERLTPSQFVQLQKDLDEALVNDVWARRFFRGHGQEQQLCCQDEYWRVPFLSVEQNKAVANTLRKAVLRVQDIGTPSWRARVRQDLVEQHGIKDADRVLDALEEKFQEYKQVFKDYAPAPGVWTFTIDPHAWRLWVETRVRTWSSRAWHWWQRQFDTGTVISDQATSEYAVVAAQSRSAELAVHSLNQAADKAVDKFNKKTDQWRASFAKFWYEQEENAMRQIGYTEKEIEWLYDYLERNFKNQADLARYNVDSALHTIRRQLHESRIHSAAQIERQITRLQELLERWKHCLPADPSQPQEHFTCHPAV